MQAFCPILLNGDCDEDDREFDAAAVAERARAGTVTTMMIIDHATALGDCDVFDDDGDLGMITVTPISNVVIMRIRDWMMTRVMAMMMMMMMTMMTVLTWCCCR